MRKQLALLLSMAAWMLPVKGQETPTFQSGTRMVLVPVVVRDHDGRTVNNLERENFQVFDKGKEQQIAAFSVERGEAPGTAAAAPPAQFIAYLFDDVSLHDFGTVMPIREAALHELANLRRDDRVAIFSSSCRLTLDFTDDRAKLQETISKLDPNPVRVCRVATTLSLQITLLDAIVKRMTHLPGAKRVVVVSAGFSVNRDEQKLRETLIDDAAQAKITIDSLHIVEGTGTQSGVPGNPNGGPQFSGRKMPSGGDTREVNSENLNIVADGTGGTVIEAGNSPEAGLRTLATPDCVYMLSFVPTEKADGSYHKLKVTLKDARKVNVRARAGYYATESPGTPVTAAATPSEAPEKRVTSGEVRPPSAPTPAKAAVDAPERSSSSGPVAFSLRTNLVQVPVVVRDKGGNPVGNLHKSDFQLSDRGQRQEITSFSEEKLERPASTSNSGGVAPAAATNTTGGATTPGAVVPDRFTAYLFDDVHMRIGDLSQVRDAVWKNMQESAGASVRMAVFTTSRRVFTDFTGDLDKLHTALFRITSTAMYRSVCGPCGDLSYFLAYQVMRGNRTALQTAEPLAIPTGASTGGNPGPPAGRAAASAGGLSQPTSPVGNEGMAAEIAAARAVRLGQQETDLSLNALRDVARRMISLAGRRTIVMLSQGFFVTDEQQGEMEQTIDWALRSGVVINTLNSGGLTTGMEMGVSPMEDDTVEPGGHSTQFTNQARLANAENLAFIADATGGTAILNSNDYLGGVRRIASPPEYRYFLGFTPHDLATDGKFHALSLKLANSALKGDSVQARRGYYAPKQGEGLPEAAAKEIENAVFTRDDVRDLPVEMRTEVKAGELTVSADIDLKLLHYRKADGRNCQELTAVAAVFDHDGNFIAGKQQTLTLKLRDQTVDGLAQKAPEKLESSFALSAGTYLVRLVVRSEDQTMTEISGQVDVQ
jgi:VWFA-related protein